MSLGDILGILGFLGAVLALLNEHDRRIWLAPWMRWWAWMPLLAGMAFLLYLVTFPAWQGLDQKVGGLPLLSQCVQSTFENRGWVLDAKDWASLLALALGIPAGLWTWLSPLRIREALRILEERRIASDYGYLSGKVRSLLASSWLFRRALKRTLPRFLLDRGVLLHWLENDPDLIREILDRLQASPEWVEFAEAVMHALGAERNKALKGAMQCLYEDDALQRPEAALFLALGRSAGKDLWERLQGSISMRSVGRGVWGGSRGIADKTDLDILESYAGRLCLSWIWLARCTPLSSAFQDSSLEGCAGTAVRKVLEDLSGVFAMVGLNATETQLLIGEPADMIDPRRRTSGAKVRIAQVVTEWFLDEWIQRIRKADSGTNRQLAIGSLFQLFRHTLEADGLSQMEQQVLITSALDDLCAMANAGSEEDEAFDPERRPTSDDLMVDLEQFNDGLTARVRKAIAPWLESRWYRDFGRTGNARYWARLERLQQRYPTSGETDS
jgi:hypothetical protein